MQSFSNDSEKKRNKTCLICNKRLNDIISSPDNCTNYFHYKCLRNYIDSRLDNKKSIKCPEKSCRKIFSRISNKLKNSPKIIYQNVIIPIDENQCGICFSKYQIPVASPDSCSHTFCFDCIKKWCTYKQECPMDRVPIKMLSLSDFPGGHITSKSEPPAVEQDLSGEGDNDELSDMACEVCHSGQNEHQLLLCDSCDRGYHIYCLPVPLRMIPEGDWFCGDCVTVENDDNAVPGRRMPRGLGRVVNNLEARLPQVNSPFNHRRARYERILAARRPRVNEPIFSSEDESDSEHSETEDELIPTRNRTNREPRRGRGRPITNRIISRGQSENRRINTQRNRGGRSVNNGGQGSLTSDIESGSEPRRKRRKLNSSEDDDDVEDDGEYTSTSEDTEPDCSTPIVTRLRQSMGSTRVKPVVTKDNGVKNLKKIKEEEEDDDEDNLNSRSQKKRLIVETDSNDEESVRISTSSSSLLSPKPCRISQQIENVTESILQRIQNSRMRKKTMVRKSSATDCNISEIENEAGTSNGKSSNSRKKRKIKKTRIKKRIIKKKKIIKKNKIVKRRPKKIKRFKMLKRKTVKKSIFANTISTCDSENTVQKRIRRMVLPNELSLLGGKNYFPLFDDDNDKINKAQTTSSSTNQSSVKSPFKLNVSLLSDIDNSQNNLRNMTLSTIHRLPDGTLIYKQKETETTQAVCSQSNVQKNDLVKTVNKIVEKNDNSKQKLSVEINNVDIIDNQNEKIDTSKIKPNSVSFINNENCTMNISNKKKITELINNTNFKNINNIAENFDDFDLRQNCSSRIDFESIKNITSKNINKISEKNNFLNQKSNCSLDFNNNHNNMDISNLEEMYDLKYNITSKNYNKIIVEKDTLKEKEKEIVKSDNNIDSINLLCNYQSSDKSVTHKHIENHLPTTNKSMNSQLSIMEKKVPQNIEIFENSSMLGDEKQTSFEKVVVDKPKSILLDGTLTEKGECSSSSTPKSKVVLPVPLLQGNSTVDTVHISKNEIVKCISRVLNNFYYDGKIDKAEYKNIIKRITEKIKKKNHSHHEKNIKAFVIQYMNFYLSKNKPANLD